jgi:hypothetical protein
MSQPSQQASTVENIESRASEFKPVEGGGETTSAELMLVLAYALMWALLVGFLGLGWRRLRSLEQRLRSVEQTLPSAGHTSE